jgi:cytochrome c5
MGIAFASRIPENHTGLPADLCQTCHLPALTTPLPEETREVGVMPSQVTHPIEGREDCRLCHETGVGGAPQFPADHIDRANEVCLVCHAAASQPTEAPVSPTEEPTTASTEATSAAGDATRGATLYANHCAVCHGDQGEGAGLAKEPLNSVEFLTSRSDDDLRQTIIEGVPNEMPPYEDKLSTEDIADIIAFFRSWQQ